MNVVVIDDGPVVSVVKPGTLDELSKLEKGFDLSYI